MFPEDLIARKVASTVQRLELYFIRENRGEKNEYIYKDMCCCHLIYVKHRYNSVALVREFSWHAIQHVL